jgi:hypothetical protein
MAKAKKGVIPPQLRGHQFKKGGKKGTPASGGKVVKGAKIRGKKK